MKLWKTYENICGCGSEFCLIPKFLTAKLQRIEKLGAKGQGRDSVLSFTTIWISSDLKGIIYGLVHCCFHWKDVDNKLEAKTPLSNIFQYVFS